MFKNTVLVGLLVICTACNGSVNNRARTSDKPTAPVQYPPTSRGVEQSQLQNDGPQPAAYDLDSYLPMLEGKRVAIAANQTSVIPSYGPVKPATWSEKERVVFTHLVDTLLERGVLVKKVFAPEHGFRGNMDAGSAVDDQTDSKTGLPIISLYGDNKAPSSEQLADIDVILFDIQDVGARFYTYISTLHYIMDSAAKYDKQVIVLDRPNPNGHYIDGPILEAEHKSFVGIHPVPIVHGMTIGEYAQMINGEGWLGLGRKADLHVVKCQNYSHGDTYELPVKPSPNLPNARAINLYPSLCLFEGTPVSVGRGTNMQFQIFGAPFLPSYDFSFVPTPMPGAKRPKHNGKRCFGRDLRSGDRLSRLDLSFLVNAFAKAPTKTSFFNPFFTKLAGTKTLQKQIESGMSPESIYQSWEDGLEKYDRMRQQYLLYKP